MFRIRVDAERAGLAPPRWALLMRELLTRMPSAAEEVAAKYLGPQGEFLWPGPAAIARGVIDGLDDAYESFHSWPLAYLLGADAHLLELGRAGYESVTRQFAHIPTGWGHPMVVQEYEQSYDWFHQGEGSLLFYHLCLAAPDDRVLRERAERFAGFLLNEGVPEPNYDFQHRVFRSPHLGSMGPGWRNFERLAEEEYLRIRTHYGLPFQGFSGLTNPDQYFADPRNKEAFCRCVIERLARGDSITNLASTSMAVNAFLLTGQQRFREWALDYIAGWQERVRNGVIADNVGLSGRVGEYLDGDAFGGHYGWTFPHGWHSLGVALTVAMQNARLLTGSDAPAEFLRRQLEALLARGIEMEGTWHVPHKQGHPGWYGYQTSIPMLVQTLRDEKDAVLWREGWFEFRPMDPQFPVWLWEMERSRAAENLVLALRNHRPGSWHSGAWKEVRHAYSKALGGHEAAWFEYLRGGFPDYPERILEHNIHQLADRLDFARCDTEDPAQYGDAYFQRRNPISTEGLFQLTTGAVLPAYNGGLPQTTLRWFGPGRPGLPEDIAVKVETVSEESVRLAIVNLSPTQTRTAVVQAGFLAEHMFTGGTVDAGNGLQPVSWPEETGAVALVMAPGAQAQISLSVRRFCRTPRARAASEFPLF